MKRFQLAILLAGVLSVGCRDRELLQPAALGAPMAVIMDGAHDGNAFFFFLPPLVPNPSSFFHAGKFNAGLSPVAEVCELTGDPSVPGAAPTCVATVFGPAKMALDLAAQQYAVNWDTKSSSLISTKFYRILVRGAARGTVLGFVDIDPVDQGVKNLKTGDVIAFQDGRTLPIKVRIEDGAFGSTNADDHVERVVPSSIPTGTLDVTTNTGFAGARFSDGWLPASIDQVVVIIERVAVNNASDETSCLRSGLEELEGCYRFRTDPDLHELGLTFRLNVIAGVCFEIPNVAGHEGAPPFALHRREEARGVPVGTAVVLEDVDAQFLRCAGFGRGGLSLRDALHSGRLGDLASASWHALVRGVGRLVQPRALYAVDFGAGGSTDMFSRFGWARHATMAVTAGNGASAPAGSVISAAVHVQNEHHGSEPIADQPVTFTITGGGGTLVASDETEVRTLTVPTNGTGDATVSWRLGAGTNTLEASTAHVTNSPRVITATGVALPGYEVLSSNVVAVPANGGFATQTVQCSAGKVVLGGGAQVVGEGSGDFETRLQESAPGTIGGGARSLWLASIKNADATPHNWQVFAVCANPPAGYEVVGSGDFQLAAGGGFTQQTAQCPTGKVVLGGGVQVVGEGSLDFNTRIQESTPGTIGGAQSLWLASINNQDVNAHDVRIFAVCANSPFGYEVVTSSDFQLGAAGGFIQETADCPAGKVVLGGGALVIGEGAGDFKTRIQESAPGTVGGGARRLWLVAMKNQDSSPHSVRISAACAPTSAGP